MCSLDRPHQYLYSYSICFWCQFMQRRSECCLATTITQCAVLGQVQACKDMYLQHPVAMKSKDHLAHCCPLDTNRDGLAARRVYCCTAIAHILQQEDVAAFLQHLVSNTYSLALAAQKHASLICLATSNEDTPSAHAVNGPPNPALTQTAKLSPHGIKSNDTWQAPFGRHKTLRH